MTDKLLGIVVVFRDEGSNDDTRSQNDSIFEALKLGMKLVLFALVLDLGGWGLPNPDPANEFGLPHMLMGGWGLPDKYGWAHLPRICLQLQWMELAVELGFF